MEDFGYSKQQEESAAGNVIKRAFLIAATLFSIACFVYVTINAYYFVYKDQNNNIETIKAEANPIKIAENQDNSQDSLQIDNSIYEDIFGNNKGHKDRDIKIRESAETALPPKAKDVEAIEKKPLNVAKEVAAKTVTKSGQIIVYSDKKESTDRSFLNPESVVTKAEAVKTTVATKPAPAEQAKGKKYVRVQIAALNSKNSANEYWKNLQRLYPSLFSSVKSFIEEVDLGKRGTFYRLQIGNFFDQIRAEEFCNKYVAQTKKSKADCIVVE